MVVEYITHESTAVSDITTRCLYVDLIMLVSNGETTQTTCCDQLHIRYCLRAWNGSLTSLIITGVLLEHSRSIILVIIIKSGPDVRRKYLNNPYHKLKSHNIEVW